MSKQKLRLNYLASISLGVPEHVLPISAQHHLICLFCAEQRFL